MNQKKVTYRRKFFQMTNHSLLCSHYLLLQIKYTDVYYCQDFLIYFHQFIKNIFTGKALCFPQGPDNQVKDKQKYKYYNTICYCSVTVIGEHRKEVDKPVLVGSYWNYFYKRRLSMIKDNPRVRHNTVLENQFSTGNTDQL